MKALFGGLLFAGLVATAMTIWNGKKADDEIETTSTEQNCVSASLAENTEEPCPAAEEGSSLELGGDSEQVSSVDNPSEQDETSKQEAGEEKPVEEPVTIIK